MEGVSLLDTSLPRNPKRNGTPMRGGSPNSYIQSPRSCLFHSIRLLKQLHFISQTSLPRDLKRNGTPMRGGSPNNHILSRRSRDGGIREESVAPFKRNGTTMSGGSRNKYTCSPRSCPFHSGRYPKQSPLISQNMSLQEFGGISSALKT